MSAPTVGRGQDGPTEGTRAEARAITEMVRQLHGSGARWLRLGRRDGCAIAARFQCESCEREFQVPIRVHASATTTERGPDHPLAASAGPLYGLPGISQSWRATNRQHPDRIKLVDPLSGGRWRAWSTDWAEAFDAWHRGPYFCPEKAGGAHE